MTTSAWETAKGINQQPVKLKFDNSQGRVAQIGGKSKVGDPCIDALSQGVSYPNVFSALQQIENTMIPVNGILFTAENYDPAGIGTTERITVQLPNQSVQNNGIIYIYGIPVELKIGEALTTVTQKISDKLALMIENDLGIDNIYRPVGTQDVLDVTFIDRNYHEVVDIDDTVLGVKITGEIIVQPQTGYGTWDKIGVNDTLVPGVELSIWRRIS